MIQSDTYRHIKYVNVHTHRDTSTTSWSQKSNSYKLMA